MKSNLMSHLTIYRSPSPVLSKYNNTKYGIEAIKKSGIRVLNKSSNSYKKLQKNYMYDTSLTYIHRLKETNLKVTPKKTPPCTTEKIFVTSSIPTIINPKISEYSKRITPFNFVSYSPETNKSQKPKNESHIIIAKEISAEKPSLNLSFPDIHQNNLGKNIFDTNNQNIVKNTNNKLKTKLINQSKICAQIKKISDVQRNFKKYEDPVTTTRAVQVDEAVNLSGWDF